MDKIFSLDISVSPAQAVVLGIEGDQETFIDSMEVHLSEPDFFERLVNQELNQFISQETKGEVEEEPELSPEDVINEFAPLKKLYEEHESDIVSSVLVVAPCSYLSLNIDLPFNSPKLIRDVISGEIQDLIPFDVNNFALNHNLIDRLPDGNYDVHAAMLPENYVASVLNFSHAFGIDPEFITTPSAALGGEVNWLADTGNQLILSVINHRIYANCLIDGKIRNAQIVDNSHEQGFPYSMIKMLILNLEKRYQTKIEQVLLLGNSISPEELRSNLNKDIAQPDYEQGGERDLKNFLIAGLAALSVSNPNQINLISNFRSGKFAYQPYGRKSLEILKKTWGYLLVALVLMILVPSVFYISKNRQIVMMENAVRESVVQKVSELELSRGKELGELMAASSAIELQLDNLGSASKMEPFEVYLVLTELLSKLTSEKEAEKSEIDILQVEIRGDYATIDGTVPSYKGVDKIERLLRAKNDVFCDVQAETPGGRSVKKKFKFKLKLC